MQINTALATSSTLALGGVGAPVVGAGANDGFLGFITSALSDTTQALGAAETTAAQAMEGKASIQHVVETMMHAERQLEKAPQ